MKLLQGKFYDDKGNVVPIEFGNKEQIRLIKEAERLIESLKEGLIVYPEYTAKVMG